MSLDVYLTESRPAEVYSANITHNLGAMAEAAGIYMHLWRPDELGITKARELIEPLRAGLERLKAEPQVFERHNAPNGWGLYMHFVPFVENYLRACEESPNADVRVSR
jgi:hypothetical protein